MIAINYTAARDGFKKYCDAAVRDAETVIVTRKPGENVVIMSEAEYNNLIENIFVRSNAADYERLLKSIDHLKRGKGRVRKLAPDE